VCVPECEKDMAVFVSLVFSDFHVQPTNQPVRRRGRRGEIIKAFLYDAGRGLAR